MFDEKPISPLYVNYVEISTFLTSNLYCEINTHSFENMFYWHTYYNTHNDVKETHYGVYWRRKTSTFASTFDARVVDDATRQQRERQ